MSADESKTNQSYNNGSDRRNGSTQAAHALHRSLPTGGRTRSDESWIEISSNPSASSLSSAGGDEIVTTGLRVQRGPLRQRRNVRSTPPTNLNTMSRPHSVGGSSQDEYEESESESEKLTSSSNEGLQIPLPSAPPPYSSSEDGASEAVSDDDEISTAINYRPSDTCFTPQPNAFSHPPSNQPGRNPHSVPGSYFPAAPRPTDHRNAIQRHSYPHPRQPQHSPFNAISPSHQADHDAALRASLSTLLSCAAAARGLSKPSSRAPPTYTHTATAPNRIDPTSLRMVPESIALAQEQRQQQQPPPPTSPAEPLFNPTLARPPTPSRTSSTDSAPAAKPAKRKAFVPGRSASKERALRAPKKQRRAASGGQAGAHWASASTSASAMDSGLEVSPTLLTWVVSAGVVVLVGALSFGAGFAMGREAGMAEVGIGVGGEGGLSVGCAREGLRGGWGWRERLRWGGGVGSVVV